MPRKKAARNRPQRQATPRHSIPTQRINSTNLSPAAAPATRDNLAPPDATDRAAKIATLYATGDIDGAADALREFRAVDPDADTYLPESLRDWARTVE